MLDTVPEQIAGLAAAAEKTKLLFVVGKPGSGKSNALRTLSANNLWKYVDCRSLLTDEFLELTPAARPQLAPELMKKNLAEYDSPVLLLDRLQVLFTPMLRLDPVSLLHELCKHFTIIAAWPGDYQDGNLIYRNWWLDEPQIYSICSTQVYKID